MSYYKLVIMTSQVLVEPWHAAYLLQSLVVDEACGILGNLELPLLNLLAELPGNHQLKCI